MAEVVEQTSEQKITTARQQETEQGVYNFLETQLLKPKTQHDSPRWRGEYPVPHKTGRVFEAAALLLSSEIIYADEPNYPYTVYGSDGETEIGLRYAQDDGLVNTNGVEVVVPTNKHSRIREPLLRLESVGTSYRKTVFGREGMAFKPHNDAGFLQSIAAVVAAARWDKVFPHSSGRESTTEAKVKTALEEKLKAAQNALAQAEADIRLDEHLREYYGNEWSTYVDVTARFVNEAGELIAEHSIPASEGDRIDAVRILLEKAAPFLGSAGLRGTTLQLEYGAGLKTPIVHNTASDHILNRFMNNYAGVYLGIPGTKEQTVFKKVDIL